MKRLLILGPLLLFILLALFLARGLYQDPSALPSPLLGKVAPQFVLPELPNQASDTAAIFTPQAMLGQVWLLNVWASWCTACREEHAILLQLAGTHVLPIIGLDYKDTAADAAPWLVSAGGNPYAHVAQDTTGRVGINYGVYGVPESYVIDKRGVIRYKQIGAITAKNLQDTILPLVKRLQSE